MLELEISNSSVPPIKKGQWRSVKGSPEPHTSGPYSWLRGRVNGNKSLSLSHEYDADGFECASQKASNSGLWGNPYILNLFENKKLPFAGVLPSPLSGCTWSSFQRHDLEKQHFLVSWPLTKQRQFLPATPLPRPPQHAGTMEIGLSTVQPSLCLLSFSWAREWLKTALHNHHLFNKLWARKTKYHYLGEHALVIKLL